MDLTELSEKNRGEYNRFVAGRPAGSFLQSWEWGDWQQRLGRRAFRFFIFDSGRPAAAMQLVQMPLPFGKNYLYCPYGPVADCELPFELLVKELGKRFPGAIFIRFEPKDKSLAHNFSLFTKTKNIQPGKTLVVGLGAAEESLLAAMHPKTRYNIRLAQKHGVEIKSQFDLSVGNGFFTKEAVDLIIATATRHGYRGFAPGYYRDIIDEFLLRNRGDLKLGIYKAVYQNRLLASALMIDFGSARTYLFGGSSENLKNVMAPYLLHWRAMLDAKAAGLSFYDFWGIETAAGVRPGFVKFKLGFGGRAQEYPGAYDAVLRERRYKIYRMFRLANSFKQKIFP